MGPYIMRIYIYIYAYTHIYIFTQLTSGVAQIHNFNHKPLQTAAHRSLNFITVTTVFMRRGSRGLDNKQVYAHIDE